jgi:hypothetical protein
MMILIKTVVGGASVAFFAQIVPSPDPHDGQFTAWRK